MSLTSLILADRFGLPKRLSRATRTRDIRIPMPDGVELAADHFAPRLAGDYPTLLMREPYGLNSFAGFAELFAERGYHVLLQAVRGTDSSGGELNPLHHEREDGLATVAWLQRQPWFDGRLGTTGPSYLGYTQWAICDGLPPGAAMAVFATSSEFRSVVFPGNSFAVSLWLSWMQTVEGIRFHPLKTALRMLDGGIDRRTRKATMKLPLRDADRRVVGHKVPFWEKWLLEAVGNEAFWQPIDHSHRIGARTPPTSFTTGWYDFMLDQLLRDYALMVDAGHTPRLIIGPWMHVSPELQAKSVSHTLEWMDMHLRGAPEPAERKPVRLFITGLDEWREFTAWPPGPPADIQIWHLHPESGLSRRPVQSAPPDTYRYDPTDPTPAIGGNMFAFEGAGPVDQAPLEARDDVLVYSSEPLFSPLTVIGNVRVSIHARASLPNADIFVRLCDVAPDGKSTNICDGIIRRTSADPAVPDDIWMLSFKLHAAAHHFDRDHRLRVLVASGAHPRFGRNTGTDEPLDSGTRLVPVDIEIFHDPAHPSTVQLPVYDVDAIERSLESLFGEQT